MILIDTSALIASLSSPHPAGPALRRLIERRERMAIPSLVLYEWRRGPRTRAEIAIQQEIFPDAGAVPFGGEEAALSAELYRRLARPRSRAVDIAIAACALRRQAALWNLNPSDFADIPELQLAEP